MKAIVQERYGSFHELGLREVAKPVAGAGEVLDITQEDFTRRGPGCDDKHMHPRDRKRR